MTCFKEHTRISDYKEKQKGFRYIYLLSLCGLYLQFATADAIELSSARRNAFAMKLFRVVAESHAHDNLIFSPASIQAAMALVYLGAEGETADEIKSALLLGPGDKDSIAADYGNFLKANFNRLNSSVQLTMANGIFVNEHLQLAPKYQQLAESYFNAVVTPMNFAETVQSASNINSWVESRTNSKIKNILQSQELSENTEAILVNAIYYKGLWANQFPVTHKSNFSLDAKDQVEVDMMLDSYNSNMYRYGEFMNLDATLVELPYKNTDVTMLLLLPNKVDGLKDLERNLEGIDLNNVAAKLKPEYVGVSLPKFKIEFPMELQDPFKKLGVSTVFSERANLSSIFTSSTKNPAIAAKHKAYVEVNEQGSEAAAATLMALPSASMPIFPTKYFTADHPFMFAIRNNGAVFFIGHVVKL